MERIVTTCDKCNPHGSLYPRLGRGLCTRPAEVVIHDFGWEQRGDEHICQDCLEEEEGSER